MDFADDIALLESSISEAQAQLSKTAEAAADLFLVISAPKTEYFTSSKCLRKSLLENMLCASQPLAKGDHVLHTLPMYKCCLGIMKDQCKNSRLPHLLMIVVHAWRNLVVACSAADGWWYITYKPRKKGW